MTDTTLTHGGEGGAERAAGKPLWLKVLGLRLLAPLALACLAVLMTVPGLFELPPVSPDETRFVEISRQMAATREFTAPLYGGSAGHAHMPAVHWLQALTAAASGVGADAPLWVYRLPSAVSAVFGVLLAYWLARTFVPPQTALLAGIFAALALPTGLEGRLATADSFLLLTVLAAQGALARLWLGEKERSRRALAVLFWVALGLSVLAGGAPGPAVILVTIAALCIMRRDVNWLKALSPLPGVILFAAIVGPWLAALYITGGATALAAGFAGAMGPADPARDFPPLIILGSAAAIFWPIPSFLILALSGLRRAARSEAVVFALCWLAPAWALAEFVSAGFPHDALMLVPPLALLAGIGIANGREPEHSAAARWIAAALCFLPALAFAAGSFAAPAMLGEWPSPPGAMLAVFGFIAAVAAARRMLAGSALSAVGPAAAAAVLITAGACAFTLPSLYPAWTNAIAGG